MVESKAAINGHPIHPTLVSIPIGLFTGTVLANLAYLLIGRQALWLGISLWADVAGVVFALLAAIFGFMDFFTIARGPVRTIAAWHMALNLTMVVLFAIAAFLLAGSTNVTLPFTLQFIGFAVMMVGGYLGGEMVYKHRMAVQERQETERARERAFTR